MDVGRELDAAVAERVMGWEWFTAVNVNVLVPPEHHWRVQRSWRIPGKHGEEDDIDSARFYDSRNGGKQAPVVPAYSTNIAAAWLVVEELTAHGLRLSLDMFGGDPWWAEFADERWERGAQATAPTAPEAICRAALAAMEVTK